MSMLTGPEVLAHLIDRGLLDPANALSGGIRIDSVSRRHNNYCVTGLAQDQFFLKQGRHNPDIGSVANELRVYRALAASAQWGIRDVLAAVHDYDQARDILTLEAIRNAENLEHYHARTHRFPKAVAAHVGKALGRLHDIRLDMRCDGSEHWGLRRVLPSVFNLRHPPMGMLRTASGVWIELTKLLQRYGRYGEELDALAESWTTDAIIHGDLKLANFVAWKERQGGRINGIKLVDWEFAGRGDPRWDVGSVFNSYLALWIYSVPITRHDRPDALLDFALFPLARMQPALRAFWSSYCDTRGLYGPLAQESLHHAVRFAAACLIQTAYEYAKTANFLAAELVTLLQVSLNMFQRPGQAAVELLGIEDNSCPQVIPQ